MNWPNPKFEFVCKGCGKTEIVKGTVDSYEFSGTQASRRIIVSIYPNIGAPFWQSIGQDLYCPDHKIEVKRELIVDGCVIDGATSPWSDR